MKLIQMEFKEGIGWVEGETIEIEETEEDKAMWKEYAKLFCKCEHKDEPEASYVENWMGVNHGWICPHCHMFKQIG